MGSGRSDIAAKLGCSEMTVYRRLQSTKPSRPSFEDWLTRKTRVDGACRRWTGAHSTLGYAIYERNGRQELVHRLVWEQRFGPIPDGAVIAHSCHSRDCLEPAHLYLTDPSRRAADTTSAARMHPGEDHWNHKLTWEAVHLIRRSQESTAVLSARYHVAPSTVASVRSWRRWRHPPQSSNG